MSGLVGRVSMCMASWIVAAIVVPFVLVGLQPTLAAAATRTVNAGGDLQAALNAAQPGDEVVVAAGARFTGMFQLPVKPNGPVITIRSSQVLPARRLTPADAPLLPVIASGGAMSALTATGRATGGSTACSSSRARRAKAISSTCRMPRRSRWTAC
jgi:hypothetical protein